MSALFNCTKLTIIRNLKKQLGDEIYKELSLKNKNYNQEITNSEIGKNMDISGELIIEISSNDNIARENLDEKKYENNSSIFSEFTEISPLDCVIESSSRKEFSSITIDQIQFPKVVYMIVDKNIELEIKLLKDYPSWEFLPNKDLNRMTIEIFFDLKKAKRDCKKEQKVIKVPNTDVFKIVSPILISRGISRIVSGEKLIAL